MKDGAIICNTGHYDCEINIPELDELTTSKRVIRPNCEEYYYERWTQNLLISFRDVLSILPPLKVIHQK